MKVSAVAKDVGISPLKVRLVVDVVRGKKVVDALHILRLLPTPTGRAVGKVVKSAAANAENNFEIPLDTLKIAEIYADEGHKLKRFRAQARGRAAPVIRRSTHIKVVVTEE
ncbi:MAG: 50S ribosomal protein L22 [Chloroflexota bacterium]